jgi:hypothetical protein
MVRDKFTLSAVFAQYAARLLEGKPMTPRCIKSTVPSDPSTLTRTGGQYERSEALAAYHFTAWDSSQEPLSRNR